MNPSMKAAPVKKPYFTPGAIILCVIVLIAAIYSIFRFLYGIGYITNLDNQYPWGIWKAILVAATIPLAAGGFTTAALVHIFYGKKYHDIVRSALLVALLGYTFAGAMVMYDMGRWYNIWRPLFWWNGNSALFEVAICVMSYLTVLVIEFLPIVIERFQKNVNLKGFLSIFTKPIEMLLNLLNRILSPTLSLFIILGVVISCLHQSSLGVVMVIAAQKVHPLWQSPVLPILFLISAISVGFPIVIIETIISTRIFGIKPKMHILSKLGQIAGLILGFYLACKITDMAIRGTYVYLTELNVFSIMYTIEILFGAVVPIYIFLRKKLVTSTSWIFTAAALTALGILLNRLNTFLVGYRPFYDVPVYYPSSGEIFVSLGFFALIFLLYRAFVMIFPVITQPVEN